MREAILLKAKRVSFAYRRHKKMTTHMDSSPRFYLTEEVFYYTEALVLFSNANVNIFFSCINNVCVRMFVSVCVRVCMCDCVCGLDRVGALGLLFDIVLHHFTPQSPFSMISPTTQNVTRENRNSTKLAGCDNECTETH